MSSENNHLAPLYESLRYHLKSCEYLIRQHPVAQPPQAILDAFSSLLESVYSEEFKSVQRSGQKPNAPHKNKKTKDAEHEDWYLVIDECGKDTTTSQNPFVLSGILISTREVANYIQRANKIKDRFFGRDIRVAFHDPYLREGKTDGIVDYSFSNNAEKQQELKQEITELITKTPCHAFAVAIPIPEYNQEQTTAKLNGYSLYPELPKGIYPMAIMLLMERCLDFLAYGLNSKPKVTVVFESIGPKEDIEHQLTFAQVLHLGTEWVKPDVFRKYFYPGVSFLTKEAYKKDKGSHPLELADILGRDVFEWLKGNGQTNPYFWNIWKQKFYKRESGRSGRFSLKILPCKNSETEQAFECLRTEIPPYRA